MVAPAPWLPLELLAVGRTGRGQTAPGTYLRWLVQPFLGVPGIAPLDHDRQSGFRLFVAHRDDTSGAPAIEPVDLEPVVPDDQHHTLLDVADLPGWTAITPPDGDGVDLDIRLSDRYQNDVAYVRVDYRIEAAQEILLHYVVHNASTGADTRHDVALHYPALSATLRRRETDRHEYLSYGIHVDELDESIVRVRLVSDHSILVHGVNVALAADRAFYRWSPPGGDGVWTDIAPNLQLLHALDDRHIRPGPPHHVVEAVTEFYREYHGVEPSATDGSRSIDVRFPRITSVPLGEPIVRRYDAEQYGELLRGEVEPPAGVASRFHITPQHAVAMASADPAVAYLLGLFRVLEGDPDRYANCIFKVQGTWADGRRFGAYRSFDAGQTLQPPRMNHVTASSAGSSRTVLDEATWRSHTEVEVADVSWAEPPAEATATAVRFGPVAYLLLRGDEEREGYGCRAGFFLPQENEVDGSGTFHFTDWYDTYPGTDIPKVLDGTYRYAVAAFDLFGQLSGFETDAVDVDPAPLEPGSIRQPRVTLSRLPDSSVPAGTVAPDIPLEVETHGAGHLLRRFRRDHVKVDYSFFWPLGARYVWDRNRATGTPSVDHFELLHLPGTPRHAGVEVEVVTNRADGVVVRLDDVAAGTATNGDLHELLDRLGAVSPSGVLEAGPTERALVGGSLVLELDWEIVEVTVDAGHRRVTLRLLPSSDAQRGRLVQGGGWTEKTADGLEATLGVVRTSGLHHGELSWNTDATDGGQPVGWKPLGSATLEVRPAPPLVRNGALVATIAVPDGVTGLPPELATSVGLIAIRLSPPTAPPAPEPAVPNHFVARLPAGSAAAKFDRLMLVPADTPSGLEPGEHPAPPLPNEPGVDHPEDVATLFSEDRITAFIATRVADDPNHPNEVVYRGSPSPFTSTGGVSAGEYLVYPDPAHADWRIVTPTSVTDLEVPLASLLGARGFGAGDYASASVTVAAKAVTSPLDHEVTDGLQTPLASIKIGFSLHRPPPVVTVPALPTPSFGVDAGRPDFEGTSLIRLESIYGGASPRAALPAAYEYTLFRLPADRVVGADVPIVHAWNPSGGRYQRDLRAVSTALASIDATDPLATPTMQTLFGDFAQRVHDKPLPKQDFLRSAVGLDGESRTVFLYAIKPHDTATGKESDTFVALSPPVYVEDPAAPPTPSVLSASVVVVRPSVTGGLAELQYEFRVRRRLDGTDRFGYVSPSELVSGLLGSDFSRTTRGYRLYLAAVDITDKTDVERLISPDTGDFARVVLPSDQIAGSELDRMSVVVDSSRMTCATSTGSELVTVAGSVDFASGLDLDKLPSRIFACLRAENYLGRFSPLRFSPLPLREA